MWVRAHAGTCADQVAGQGAQRGCADAVRDGGKGQVGEHSVLAARVEHSSRHESGTAVGEAGRGRQQASRPGWRARRRASHGVCPESASGKGTRGVLGGASLAGAARNRARRRLDDGGTGPPGSSSGSGGAGALRPRPQWPAAALQFLP